MLDRIRELGRKSIDDRKALKFARKVGLVAMLASVPVYLLASENVGVIVFASGAAVIGWTLILASGIEDD